mmetsp:Transcript_149716/g.212860  ORF Transcript_149716/g.212860 Transcript_149716/m.212860 type:complete len:85 (+) Transcript_149716:89-343(+)
MLLLALQPNQHATDARFETQHTALSLPFRLPFDHDKNKRSELDCAPQQLSAATSYNPHSSSTITAPSQKCWARTGSAQTPCETP